MSEPSHLINSNSRPLDLKQPNTMVCPECWCTNSCLSTLCQCGFHLANFRNEQRELREKHKRLSRNGIRKRVGLCMSLAGILCLTFVEWQGIQDMTWQLLPYGLIVAGVALICSITKGRP